ncbi:hypothetical protein [Chitinophaga sp. GbtcB8]|uniref:hypothetical protein n=1 Tax=Chitinophaga sp. GbtcB8 TaxID=2824753 RepID=UPI001C2F3269|nr:hypothetical protein [Chitinophaga sp. GbtcB8]
MTKKLLIAQAGASILKRDSFPLPHDFASTKTEAGGWRDNSYNNEEPVRNISDRTFTAGIENELQLTRQLLLLTVLA